MCNLYAMLASQDSTRRHFAVDPARDYLGNAELLPAIWPKCRVALKFGTRRVGQRVLPLNVVFRRQLVGVFPYFAVQSGQLLQEDGALFQTHEARQLLRTHRGQC